MKKVSFFIVIYFYFYRKFLKINNLHKIVLSKTIFFILKEIMCNNTQLFWKKQIKQNFFIFFICNFATTFFNL